MQGRSPVLGRKKNNKASVLITTVIVFAFFSTIGLALIALLYSHVTSIQLESDRLKAMYLAEAGIAQALYELRVGKDTDNIGIGNIKSRKLGEGKFWVEHDMQTSTLTSVGEVNNVRRILRIRYNSL